LSKHREPFKWKNTTYYKTAKEKRTNRVMDIKIYDKALHAGLDTNMMRLEFCFKSGYLKKLPLHNIKSVCKFHKHSSTRFTFRLPLISQNTFHPFHFLPSIF